VNSGSVTGSSAIGDGDCDREVGDGDSSRGALAVVDIVEDPDATADGDAELTAPTEPQAHSTIAAIGASALMTA